MTDTIIQPTPEAPSEPFPHPLWCLRAPWTGEGHPVDWTGEEEEDHAHRGEMYFADSLQLSNVGVTRQVVQHDERHPIGGVLEHEEEGIEVVLRNREGIDERAEIVYTRAEFERLLTVGARVIWDLKFAQSLIEEQASSEATP